MGAIKRLTSIPRVYLWPTFGTQGVERELKHSSIADMAVVCRVSSVARVTVEAMADDLSASIQDVLMTDNSPECYAGADSCTGTPVVPMVVTAGDGKNVAGADSFNKRIERGLVEPVVSVLVEALNCRWVVVVVTRGREVLKLLSELELRKHHRKSWRSMRCMFLPECA